jgi:hypothetical protein
MYDSAKALQPAMAQSLYCADVNSNARHIGAIDKLTDFLRHQKQQD